MAIDIRQIVSNKPTNGQNSPFKVPEQYLESLHYYWSGDSQTAVERAATALADQPDHDSKFLLYRLWIEILADQNDTRSLRLLADHLLKRGRDESSEHDYFMALRGLVHFELDEYDAASLLSRATSGVYSNPYCLELEQLVELRISGADLQLQLTKSKSEITDFFHWQTIARSLKNLQETRNLETVLTHVRKIYPASPMPDFYEMHHCFDAKNYGDAAVSAAKLCRMYPDHPDYNFFFGYALFGDGEYSAAIDALEHTLHLAGESDTDTNFLLGQCYDNLGDHVNAAKHLKQTVGQLKNDGLPATLPALQYAEAVGQIGESDADAELENLEPPRMWLIKLSPRQYHTIQTSDQSEINQLFWPMGIGPRPNELCFFAAPSAPGKWRISAIFVVETEPVWHPIDHYQTALQLVSRPQEGIPVDVHLLDEEHEPTEEELGKNHPYSYGVFELEMGALDIITEAIRRRNEGAKDVSNLEIELSRYRHTS